MDAVRAILKCACGFKPIVHILKEDNRHLWRKFWTRLLKKVFFAPHRFLRSKRVSLFPQPYKRSELLRHHKPKQREHPLHQNNNKPFKYPCTSRSLNPLLDKRYLPSTSSGSTNFSQPPTDNTLIMHKILFWTGFGTLPKLHCSGYMRLWY